MKYKYLNKILLSWGNSEENIQDNNIIKSSGIKKEIDKYFIYKLNKKENIQIFGSPHWAKYIRSNFNKHKIYINGKHITKLALGDRVCTTDKFNPGEYRVYIEDIDQVENIEQMFWGCKQLVKAFIPDSVRWVDEFAFCETSLTDITIPDCINAICNYAFSACWNLTNITIPNSVKWIGENAFDDCGNLTSITIPNSIEHIYRNAFFRCNNLKKIYVEDINKFNQIKFGNEFSNPLFRDGAKLIEI